MELDLRAVVEGVRDYVVPDLGIGFVDREFEVGKLLGEYIRGRGYEHLMVVTGPWGCGKSQFARAIVHALSKVGNYIAVYVDLTQEEIGKVVYPLHTKVSEVLMKLISEVLGDVVKIPLYLYQLFTELRRVTELEGKVFLLIIDEVTRSLEKYRLSIRDFISCMSMKIFEIRDEVGLESLYSIVLTSEQTAMQYFLREIGKNMYVYLLWNLPREAHDLLLSRLDIPPSLSTELLWRLTGGNPREVKCLRDFNWNVSEYVSARIELMRDVYRYAARIGVLDYLRTITESVDELVPYVPDEVSPEFRLCEFLLRNNVVIRVDARLRKLSKVPSEPWVGKVWSFQVPIYYWILKTMVSKQCEKVTPRDVISVVLRE